VSTFVLSYRMAKNYTPGRPDAVAAWQAFFAGIDANVVDRGKPVFERSTLGDCSDATVLGGYSLITADDLEGAIALAKRCPAAGVEVGELAEVPASA
jgi:hypothetical protein